MALSKKLKIEKNVIFLGSIQNDLLLKSGYYQVADVFLVPSASETQGISILEAMYFGVPIVGVVGRGSEELIGEVGVLIKSDKSIEFANAIIELLNNKSLQDTLRIKSKQIYMSKYNQQKIMIELEALYSKIIKYGGDRIK